MISSEALWQVLLFVAPPLVRDLRVMSHRQLALIYTVKDLGMACFQRVEISIGNGQVLISNPAQRAFEHVITHSARVSILI